MSAIVNGSVDKSLRDLVELAHDQGWRVERRNNDLAWFPPSGQGLVHTPARLPSGGRVRDNVLAELRRAGLRDRPEPVDHSPQAGTAAISAPALSEFGRDLVGLIEQELERRTQNLVDQVEALRNENADLRHRVAEAEGDVERRATEAALRAVQEVLASRKTA